MKLGRKTCAVALVILALSSSAFGADLVVTNNASDHSLTITSQLASDVNLVALSNGSETVNLGGSIPAGGTLSIQYTRDLPAGLNSALCRPASGADIAGHAPGEDGVFVLSVAAQ